MHIHRDRDQAGENVIYDEYQLILRGYLKYLLTQVVSELIHHQVSEALTHAVDESAFEIAWFLVIFKLLL